MNLITNSDRYHGEVIDHFEDETGETLEDINMESELIIVFKSGVKIKLGLDWYGQDCYISQKDNGEWVERYTGNGQQSNFEGDR